jgi:hypothetical protein
MTATIKSNPTEFVKKPEPEAKVDAVLTFCLNLFLKESHEIVWTFTEYEQFKRAVDTVRANFGQNVPVILGNIQEPETGLRIINMNHVIAIETFEHYTE